MTTDAGTFPDRTQAVLRFIYQQRHATAADVERYVVPELGRRSIQLLLGQLCRDSFVAWTLLYPEQGARSPRVYHLLQAGARAIGQVKLGNHHYRPVNRLVYAQRHAVAEVHRVVELCHGTVLWEEHDGFTALRAALALQARRQYEEDFAPHTYAQFLPHALRPDSVLVFPAVTVICSIGVLRAGSGFWRSRLKTYEELLLRRVVPLLLVALDEDQQHQAVQVVTRRKRRGSIVVTMADGLEAAIQRVTSRREAAL